MKIPTRTFLPVFSTIVLALASPTQAAVTLDFQDFTLSNKDIAANYGSNLAGAANVSLDWTTGGSNLHWDEYLNWRTAGASKVQLDFASPAAINTIDILFTPDAGFASYVSGFELDAWGSGAVNWSLLDGTTTLFNGSWTPATDGTTAIVTGMTSATALAGPLTARFDFVSGGRGNIAMDQLQFGQTNVPEPSASLLLLSAGLGLLARRRR